MHILATFCEYSSSIIDIFYSDLTRICSLIERKHLRLPSNNVIYISLLYLMECKQYISWASTVFIMLTQLVILDPHLTFFKNHIHSTKYYVIIPVLFCFFVFVCLLFLPQFFFEWLCHPHWTRFYIEKYRI